jgi:hypothetical protein
MATMEATAGTTDATAPDIVLAEPAPRERARPAGPDPLLLDWPANLLVAAPVFLHPHAGTARDVALALAAVALFVLVDAAAALLHRPGWLARLLGPALLLAGTVALGPWLGREVVAVAGIFLAIQLCRRFWERRSTLLAVLLAAAAAAARVDAGSLALDLAGSSYLLLAAAALGGFVAGGGARQARAQLRRGRGIRLPTRREQVLDAALALLLCGAVVANLAMLGSDPLIEQVGGVWVLLAVPFLLAALARYVHLFFLEAPSARRTPMVADPWLLLAGTGWAVALTLALPLSSSL